MSNVQVNLNSNKPKLLTVGDLNLGHFYQCVGNKSGTQLEQQAVYQKVGSSPQGLVVLAKLSENSFVNQHGCDIHLCAFREVKITKAVIDIEYA